MPVDGSGIITRPGSPLPVTGQDADAPQVNVPIDDIYAALNMLAFLDGRKPLRGNMPMNGYRATGAADASGPQDYVTLSQVQSLLSSFGSVPTGSLFPLTGTTIPPGYVRANGQTLARATFPALWAWVQASGNIAATEGGKTRGQYGPGDGSTTFTVPNLDADNGYFIRPMGSGRTVGSVQDDAFKEHDHSGATGAMATNKTHGHGVSGGIYGGNTPGNAAFAAGPPIPTGTEAISIGSANIDHVHPIPMQGGAETRPKNVSYPWIIKA